MGVTQGWCRSCGRWFPLAEWRLPRHTRRDRATGKVSICKGSLKRPGQTK